MIATGKVYRAAIVGPGEIAATSELRGTDLGHLRGIFGSLSHAAAYHDHPRVELAAGSSKNVERRAAFSREWGAVNVYSDWKTMLEREVPDIANASAVEKTRLKNTGH